ncbi:MAG: rhomboid family intramembrane serine protease [Pseudorhodobacter sp.]
MNDNGHLRQRITFGLIGTIALIEVILSGADLGLWGARNWRAWAYILGSFQPQLLGDARPFWPGQPAGMFLTHIFVHTGLWHVTGNLVALAILSSFLRGMRPSRFLALFFLSAFGAALVFAMIAPSGTSMTGASGAINGLAAFWGLRMIRKYPRSLYAAISGRRALFFVLLIVIGIAQEAMTAWQAHLGGALTGLIFALLPYQDVKGSRHSVTVQKGK